MSGYIGNIPVPQATQTRDNFTATDGQTTFSTSGYTPSYLDVYLNGIHLDPSDYTATNGTDVVLASGATVGDVVTVVAYTTFEVGSYGGDLDVTGTVTADRLTVSGTSGDPLATFQDTDGTAVIVRLQDVSDYADIVSNAGNFLVKTGSGALGNSLRIDPDNDISFYEDTGTTAKFFWDASAERLGIGTSSPSGTLTVFKDVDSVTVPTAKSDYSIAIDVNGNVSGSYVGGIAFGDSAVSTAQAAILAVDSGGSAATSLAFATGTTGGISEAMRIDSSGNVLVGTTSTINSNRVSVNFDTTTRGIYTQKSGTGFAAHIGFYNSNGEVGYISTNGSATTYNTSSDYRLKEDWQPMSGSIDRLKNLNPVNFAWISSGERVDGFLAHEAQEVVPESVNGTKDAVDAEGNPEYQGIDQSKLVPLLTSALQEAIAKIETLETRIAALEN